MPKSGETFLVSHFHADLVFFFCEPSSFAKQQNLVEQKEKENERERERQQKKRKCLKKMDENYCMWFIQTNSLFFFFNKWRLIFKLCIHQPHKMSTAYHWAKFKSGGNLIQKRLLKNAFLSEFLG